MISNVTNLQIYKLRTDKLVERQAKARNIESLLQAKQL
jgi:hypothetical protein